MNDSVRHSRGLFCRYNVVLWLLVGLTTPGLRAESPRVLPAGKQPGDVRLQPLVTLGDNHHDDFPFDPPESKDAWLERSERLRRQLLVANGLWPMPTKTPAHAVVHGRIDRGDYTVEKVYLESFPGHFVTGNLYRPKGGSGPRPGVLCPHGHWANGRFYDAGEKKIRQEIVQGAERFDPAGRYPLQARCVQLARMGCVVFHYDMVGYADSTQLAHRPGLRDRMDTPQNWGYFSPQAEARLQNMMGLQTYNSIRTLDWFEELPEVDPARIAVTGGSGGGTQTFILCAIDRRPAVAFPAVMVSARMQGGCTCENACYLRVETGNIEIAGLIAPRPLGMTAALDWTQNIANVGFPELKQLYKMLDVESQVAATPMTHFMHNYNYVSRAVMYGWLNKHLELGFEEPIVEEDFQPLSEEEMTVWDDEHPRPPAGDDYERSLVGWINKDSEKQMAALVPTDADSLARYRQIVGAAVDVMIGRRLEDVRIEIVGKTPPEDHGDYLLVRWLVRNTAAGEELPTVVMMPKQSSRREAVIWIDPIGKQGLFDESGEPKAAVRKLLAAGKSVVGVDLFGQGEFTADGEPIQKARLVTDSGRDNWAGYAGYTFGYNHSLFSKRVHDILTMIALVKHGGHAAEKVHLIGLAGAGPWVAAALAQAPDAVDRVVVDTAGFRFADVAAFDDPDFLPGGAKYLDLPGILALAAPGELWLAGEGAEAPPVVAAAYRAAGQTDQLTVFDQEASKKQAAAVDWILR